MTPDVIKFYKYKPVDKPQFSKKFCSVPFSALQIDYDGDVQLCTCQFHMPYTIGNIYQNSLEEIWLGDEAQKVRQAVIDGTFKYCSWDCSSLYNLPDRKNQNTSILPFPTKIKLDLEKSCNLKCPSCRETVIIEKQSDKIEKQIELYQEIVNRAKSMPAVNFLLYPCASGEIFASHSGLAFLKSLQDYPHKNLKLHVASNGTLINKNRSLVQSILPLIEKFAISIDAATPETYAKVRGGDWQELVSGLDFLHSLKTKINFSFIIQKENYQEITTFYDLVKNYNGTVNYYNLEDWGHWTIQWWRDNTVVAQSAPELTGILRSLDTLKTRYPHKIFLTADITKLLQKFVQKTA